MSNKRRSKPPPIERQLDLLRAQIAQQEAMLTQVRQAATVWPVVAPISGLVTGALSAGTPVNEARAILTIAQIDNLKLLGEVPARYTTLVGVVVWPRKFPPGKGRLKCVPEKSSA